MSRPRRRVPFERMEDGHLALDLPPGVREYMLAAAERLRATGSAPGSAGFERLFGPIDATSDVDDPAYVLARQMAVDDVVATVTASAHKEVIDPDEAEAWLKVLGMTLSRRAAELGIETEEDRRRVGTEDEAVLRVAYVLQVALIEALDEEEGA